MGQLLVVAHHTDNSPSLCYEPELIPDPIGIRCFNTLASLLDLGSDTITAVFYRNTSGKSTDP